MTGTWKDPRFALALLIVALFAYAYAVKPSDGLEASLISLASTAVGYWLGSSNSSARKDQVLADALGRADAAAPQEVKVINDPDEPVPVDGTNDGESK